MQDEPKQVPLEPGREFVSPQPDFEHAEAAWTSVPAEAAAQALLHQTGQDVKADQQEQAALQGRQVAGEVRLDGARLQQGIVVFLAQLGGGLQLPSCFCQKRLPDQLLQ